MEYWVFESRKDLREKSDTTKLFVILCFTNLKPNCQHALAYLSPHQVTQVRQVLSPANLPTVWTLRVILFIPKFIQLMCVSHAPCAVPFCKEHQLPRVGSHLESTCPKGIPLGHFRDARLGVTTSAPGRRGRLR
jgi:hypothetical protein